VKQGPGLQNLLFAQWQKDGARVVVWPKESAKGPMIPPPWMSN
jgi:branched-chain amino acid transport system substrate-binding protein